MGEGLNAEQTMREATNGLFNVELIAVASVVNTFNIAFVVTFNIGFAVGLAVVIIGAIFSFLTKVSHPQ